MKRCGGTLKVLSSQYSRMSNYQPHAMLCSGQINENEVGLNIRGLVGGCVFRQAKGTHCLLTSGLQFVDQAFLAGSISNRINSFRYPKHHGEVDFHYTTFDQKCHTIACSGMRPSTDGDLEKAISLSSYSIERHDSLNVIRQSVGVGVQALQRRGIREISVDPCGNAEAAAEGAYLGAFVYDELKSIRGQTVKPSISCFTNHVDYTDSPDEARQSLLVAWQRGYQLALAQNLARKWMEMPANLLSPTIFANQVYDVLEGLKAPNGGRVEVKVYDQSWCRAQHLRGLLAVGAGSRERPAFLQIIYEGRPSKPKQHVALVGKGVTFDAGGISLKPNERMEEMRGDMGGAAVVVATIFGLANLQIPINVHAYLPLCENMPSGHAMRPGDVIRMANGTTVQVNNTDAEGRLILADAIHFALKSSSDPPALLIDIATLTGSISAALGDQFGGIFCSRPACRLTPSTVWVRCESGSQLWAQEMMSTINEVGQEMLDDVIDDAVIVNSVDSLSRHYLPVCLRLAGVRRGDLLWNMPIVHSRTLRNRAHLADLMNITEGELARKAGAGSAAGFLSHFVPKTLPWIHLDIAGIMQTTATDIHMRKGMSGRPTRGLIEFLRILSSTCPSD